MSQSASETMPLFPQITSTSRLSTRSGWFTTWRKCLRFREQLSSRLWLTFASVMVATFIARVPYIFPNGFEVNLTRGENYHFRIPLNKAFLWTHIASILPAGLLAVIQFVPRVRAQAIHVHRIVGRIVNVLVFISVVTAWGIARVSLGGDLAVQSGLYLLGVMILWSAVKSWMAIRRLQIDEHREWVIRTWSYTMSIVTLRVVMVVSMITISIVGGFYQAIRCEEVAYIINNASLYVRSYPQCQAEWTGSRVTHVAVEANIDDGSQLGLTAALNCVFGMSTWVGIWIHAIGTEYYLYKTKDESDRLREISARRQIAFCTPEATTDNRK